MTTTPAAPPAARPKRRQGDRIFAGLSRGAGIFILVALAGVFVFLAIEGIPGLTQPASFYARRPARSSATWSRCCSARSSRP